MINKKLIHIRFYVSFLFTLIFLMMTQPAFSQGGHQIESLKIPVQKKETKGMSAADLLKQMEATSKPPEQKPLNLEEPIEKENAPKVALDNKKIDTVVEKKKPEPIKQDEKKKVVSSKKTKTIAVTKTDKSTYIHSNSPPPLPNMKPTFKTHVAETSSYVIDYTGVPSDIVMNKDIALRIALEYAPPARSFTVFEGRDYKGTTVYQVTFRTESGPHDILVDAQNGKVLKR